MPGPHAKFHQNCCTSLGEKRAQDTDGHSFIIIRILFPFSFLRMQSLEIHMNHCDISSHSDSLYHQFLEKRTMMFLYNFTPSYEVPFQICRSIQ